MSINLAFEYYLFIYFYIKIFVGLCWFKFFFCCVFWLFVTFCLHALVVNTSGKMWENFNVWVLYFPVLASEKMWENFKLGKILKNRNKNVKWKCLGLLSLSLTLFLLRSLSRLCRVCACLWLFGRVFGYRYSCGYVAIYVCRCEWV